MTVFENELSDMTSTATDVLTDPDCPLSIDAYVLELPYGHGYTTYRTDIAGVTIDREALATRVERIGVGPDVDGSALWTPLNTEWRYVKAYQRARSLAAGDADYADMLHGRAPADQQIDLQTYASTDSGYRQRKYENQWDWLTDKGFLRPATSHTDQYGDLVVPADVVDLPFHGDQWAFELKPRDWEKALEQAARAPTGAFPEYWERSDTDPTNGGYADFAVVVMDADHVDPAIDNADRFREHGVGLASLDRDGLVVHVEPDRQDPPKWSRQRIDLNERTLPGDYPIEGRD